MAIVLARSAAALLLAVAGGAQAGNLQAAPVSLQFAAADKSQALWLTNSGQQVLHAQVRVYRWSQTEDEDRLEPTQGLVASPPLIEIAPGASQLVRIVRKPEVQAVHEEAFRLLVDEIPAQAATPSQAASAPGGGQATQRGLRLLLQYSIPVFVGGNRGAPPATPEGVTGSWAAGPVPALTIGNPGGRRLRISQVVHEDLQGRRTVLVPGLLGYVLAKQRRRWELPAAGRHLGPGWIKARLHEAAQEFPVAAVGQTP